MKFSFLVALAFCFPALSIAANSGGDSNDDCSSIRLDQPENGTAGSMQFVQVRDQGSYGICFAETAAELLDAYRFSRLDDSRMTIQSSALAATVDYSFTTGGDPYTGGSTCKILNYLSVVGSQDDAAVSSCIENFETASFDSAIQEIYDRESNQLNLEKQLLLSQDLSQQDVQSRFNQTKQSIYQGDIANIQGLLASRGMSSQQMPKADTIISIMDMPLPRLAWGLAAYSCSNSSQSIQEQVPLCVDSVPLSNPSIIATWNARLNVPQAEPIEVSYCSPVLKEGRSYPGVMRTDNTHQCAPSTTTSTPNHASLIIGRRRNPNTGSCQFLIRNSWGTACKVSQIAPAPGNVPKDTRPSLAKAPSIPDPSTDLRYAPEWDCEDGNIWVDADSLAQSAYRTSWISDGNVSF